MPVSAHREIQLDKSQRCRFLVLVMMISLVVSGSSASAQRDQNGPNLVICGGGSVPKEVTKRFRELAGAQPKLVIIPTASRRKVDLKELTQLWGKRGFSNVSVLHTNDREMADKKSFVKTLEQADAVWFSGGSQQRIADAYLDTRVEEELYRLLSRGGVIGGTSAGAAIQSRVMIAGGGDEPEISKGFDLLPGAIFDQHFLWRNRLPRLTSAIRKHPKLVGFGIDEQTALVAAAGELQVVGKSYVMRIQSINDKIHIDAFHNGESIPIRKLEMKRTSTRKQ